MTRRRALPDDLGDAFTVRDALAAGVSPGRLRAADLERTFHAVRVKAGEDDRGEHPEAGERAPTPDELARAAVRRKAQAYSLVMSPNAFFAGRTAAALFGAPLDPGPDLVVGVAGPARAPRSKGIRGVKVQPDLVHVVEHESFRLASAASTWAMLASELSVRELVIVGDALVRIPRDSRGRPMPDEQLTTIDALERAVSAGRRVGAARLREALPLVRVGSSSPLETDFRLLAAGVLPEFELDVDILDHRNNRLGISEFFHRPTRTVIEVEGDHHRVDKRQWNRDIDKYTAYAAVGIETVRLTSSHIRGQGPQAVEIVRSALTRRGWKTD